MSTAIKIDVHQLPHGEGLALPTYQTAHAAGLDLLAAVPDDAPQVLLPGQHAMVPTGLTIALPDGYEAQVRPRSGLAAKHGVTVLNAPGQPRLRAVSDPTRRTDRADGDRARHTRGTRSCRRAVIDGSRRRRFRVDGAALNHASRSLRPIRSRWLRRSCVQVTDSSSKIQRARLGSATWFCFFPQRDSRSRSGLLPTESH